jgi:hypothetical protein
VLDGGHVYFDIIWDVVRQALELGFLVVFYDLTASLDCWAIANKLERVQ